MELALRIGWSFRRGKDQFRRQQLKRQGFRRQGRKRHSQCFELKRFYETQTVWNKEIEDLKVKYDKKLHCLNKNPRIQEHYFIYFCHKFK